MSSAGNLFAPGRLWSLWEIMKKLNGAMFSAYSFIVATRNKWALQHMVAQDYSAATLAILRERTEILSATFHEVGMRAFANAADGLLLEIDRTEVLANGEHRFTAQNYGSAMGHLNVLAEYLGIDFAEKYLLVLDPANVRHFEQSLMGEKVEAAFVDAIYDLAEAGKCLALERSTAAVFHLMRAMETAVRILGQKLQATVVNEHGETLAWGILVANIKPKIEALPRGPKQDEWLKLHALLHSVNRAFRTKTAHPAQKYTQEEAENASNATKAFMQEMAERLSDL
jgi:hypothetical protein